jgi:hypothetical protein
MSAHQHLLRLDRSAERDLHRCLANTRLRPPQRKALVGSVEGLEALSGIAQTDPVRLVALRGAALSRIPDDQPQSFALQLSADRNAPPSTSRPTQCPMAFSSSGCSNMPGTTASRVSGGMVRLTRNLSPSRVCSIARYRFVRAISRERRISASTSSSRLVRKSSPICASVRVAAGTSPSSTRVETALRELNKK